MERKEFIKRSCTACMAVAAGFTIMDLASCAALPVFKPVVTDHKIAVPGTMFASTNFQIISPKGFENDIALRKEKDGTYTALLMRCTHADNQLVSTGNGFVCNLHGSEFDKEGAVTQGPAEQPLKKYATAVNGDNIIITVN